VRRFAPVTPPPFSILLPPPPAPHPPTIATEIKSKTEGDESNKNKLKTLQATKYSNKNRWQYR